MEQRHTRIPRPRNETLLLLFTLTGAVTGAACSGVDRDDNTNQNNNQNSNQNSNHAGDQGTLSGNVTAGVTCDASDAANDCQGTLYLVVMAENPAVNPYQTPEAVKILPASDLAGSQSVVYTIQNLAVGTWYISGFLDDDGNASSSLPSPDLGDPVGYPAPQVTITADETTTENIVLTVRLP